MHCQHGQTMLATWESFLKSDPTSSPNIKCVRMRQALGEKASMKPKYCMFQAELQVRFDVVKPAGHELCKASAGCPSSGMVVVSTNIFRSNIWRSLKIEAGYSPCQTILYSIESYWILWWLGDPPWLRKPMALDQVLFASPLNENVQVWLHHWEVSVEYLQQWDIPVPWAPWDGIFTTHRGKSTVSPSMGTDSFPSDSPLPLQLKRAHLKVTFWTNVSHQK